MAEKIFRVFFSLVIGGIFATIGYYLEVIPLADILPLPSYAMYLSWAVLGILGLIIGFFTSPYVWQKGMATTRWLEGKITKMPVADIVSGTLGLIVGLIIANLLRNVILAIPLIPWIANTLWILLTGVLCYLGLSVAVKKREELFGFLNFIPKIKRVPEEPGVSLQNPKILDTSVIIDGRILDLCYSGFIEGTLLVPSFVIDELRHIADSSDNLKRNRGRRGLDILNQLKNAFPVEIVDYPENSNEEVDVRLVKLAQKLKAKILTHDYNLNKVAELQGVKVLNINELANAIKPVVIPGEEMVVMVIKEGKEQGQGVGYLDDGTMIVVEGGKKYIGQQINMVVTSVLQTAAGRLIFGKPKEK
ncbi:PIN/TRAM domain-containing protein [Carboxydothermus pertinax]|uniref:PIN/TRAM domain protein n=1 Tax=Carboxydothermus pertinax TaxID=870242 RepID=A0A1L8CW42_9THEO|nr:PIN/TRAM domain-containing protein [Carboxydothermus pertinax]GAV23138.1 PIN/TRAM domain protein [Carboxydothermus pertinax]